jgi:hypothetical protein
MHILNRHYTKNQHYILETNTVCQVPAFEFVKSIRTLEFSLVLNVGIVHQGT